MNHVVLFMMTIHATVCDIMTDKYSDENSDFNQR